MDSLVVDLNRSGPHSIDVAASAFHPRGPFEVVLDNHGAALHVHLHPDDDLAQAVRLSAANHFVDQDTVRRVDVDVDPAALPVRGRLEVVTGYGSETEYVTVTVEEPDPGRGRVEVDETLGAPRPRPDPRPNRLRPDAQSVPILALGALTVVVALLAALAVGDGLHLLAVLIVLVGAGVGVVLLRR